MKRSARRWIARLGALLAVAGAAAAVTTVPANADNGDGQTACNSGEICFYYTYSFGSLTRQYWNADMDHSNDYYWDVANGQQSNIRLMDTAGSMRNFDTDCAVKIWDITGSGGWFVTWTAPIGWQGDLRSVGKENRNNGHSRC
ncbi:hypothetical protein E1263_22435 [Kribbella antibiotica]|uniref:Peptidase inhibitor family I36 protein n=1 Tax=Kribbella antibiotica TaxID=190195 RepID=A0A4R4ZIZ1_9ACTN|nr:hypothetical protein [Kribbella antibiotica]TDD57724.1 hypothetical protein E1263_22435 [Kribbella antibiotica]